MREEGSEGIGFQMVRGVRCLMEVTEVGTFGFGPQLSPATAGRQPRRITVLLCVIAATMTPTLSTGAEELWHANQPQNKPEDHTPAVPDSSAWTAEEVATAAAQCNRLAQLNGLNYTPQAPIKQGHCGDAAPVKLISIGSRSLPLVPPIVANCRIAEGVHTWIETVVQPAARALLGQDVVRLVGVSSYVCRNRNGAAVGPVSEHAYANAFDVTSFVLSDGREISVKEWIPATTNAGLQTVTPKASPSGTTQTPIAAPPAKDEKAEAHIAFLKRIHHEACRIFGTVLGPEANAAHLEHLHLDMKARKGRGYCQ